MCRHCGNEKRLLRVSAKCSDMCYLSVGGADQCDYVPDEYGIGTGDYVTFVLCLNCGRVQGEFPLPPTHLEDRDRYLG